MGGGERVTICRDARLERPLCQKLQRQCFNGDGRTSRASLQRVTRLSSTDTRSASVLAGKVSRLDRKLDIVGVYVPGDNRNIYSHEGFLL